MHYIRYLLALQAARLAAQYVLYLLYGGDVTLEIFESAQIMGRVATIVKRKTAEIQFEK
jgi:hypothetical protein